MALGLVADEPDQVPRLQVFRAAHPDVITGPGGFGTWQARIPRENGQIVTSRYTLRELLNRLDELTAEQDAQSDADPLVQGVSRPVGRVLCRRFSDHGECTVHAV
jgi:hypothetical protein